MVLDALRGYLQIASGLGEVTVARATDTAKALLASTGDGVEALVPPQLRDQVSNLAEELVAQSRANRDLLLTIIRSEVERTVSRLGLASAEDVADLDTRVGRVEAALVAVESRVAEDKAEDKVTPHPSAVSTTPVRAERVRRAARTVTAGAAAAAVDVEGGDGDSAAARRTRVAARTPATSSAAAPSAAADVPSAAGDVPSPAAAAPSPAGDLPGPAADAPGPPAAMSSEDADGSSQDAANGSPGGTAAAKRRARRTATSGGTQGRRARSAGTTRRSTAPAGRTRRANAAAGSESGDQATGTTPGDSGPGDSRPGDSAPSSGSEDA